MDMIEYAILGLVGTFFIAVFQKLLKIEHRLTAIEIKITNICNELYKKRRR